jgi:hypothetical protein
MLYIIGGASREGKSKLARRLLRERRLPHLSLDKLLIGNRHWCARRGLWVFRRVVDTDSSPASGHLVASE